MVMNKDPKTVQRRVRQRIKRTNSEMVTLGDQMRMIRELRGMSKDHLARLMGCDTTLITRMEAGFMEGVSFRKVHRYFQEVYGTLIAVPMPFPSFLDHRAHRVQIYSPNYIPNKNNLKED